MENLLEKLFKPFLNFLNPKPLGILPLLPAVGALAAQAGAGAAGAGVAGAAAGGIGGLLTKALPFAQGAAQGIGALRAGGRARALQPPAEDPEQRRFLNEIQQQRRSFQTGVAFRQTQRALRQQQALGARGALRAGRPDLLARLTRGTQTAFGEAAAKRGQEVTALTQLQGDLLQRISQRRLDLARTQQSKEEARQAGLRREAFGNVLGGVAQNVKLGEGGTQSQGFGAFLGAAQQALGRPQKEEEEETII